MALSMSRDVLRHNKTLIANMEKGDLIEFPRGAYSHWAVYIGKEKIVHLTGDDNDGINGQFDFTHFLTISGVRFNKGMVKMDNFWDVVLGCKALKNNSRDSSWTPRSKETIVREAIGRIGSVGYNVMFDNCEHFAKLCRYGLSKSDQIDNVLTGLAVGTALAATAGIVWGLSKMGTEKKKERDL